MFIVNNATASSVKKAATIYANLGQSSKLNHSAEDGSSKNKNPLGKAEKTLCLVPSIVASGPYAPCLFLYANHRQIPWRFAFADPTLSFSVAQSSPSSSVSTVIYIEPALENKEFLRRNIVVHRFLFEISVKCDILFRSAYTELLQL